MNEITISGNVTADPVLRYGRDSDTTAFLAFTVAVNRTYWDRARNARIEQPAVFHSVVAFRGLAENAAATLRKGMAVTVTGQFADDSYVPDGSDPDNECSAQSPATCALQIRQPTASYAAVRGGSCEISGAPAIPGAPDAPPVQTTTPGPRTMTSRTSPELLNISNG